MQQVSTLGNQWREVVHSFSDTNRRIYTVTNVPNQIILPVSRLPDEPDATMSLHDMRRLQVADRHIPEAAFLLRTNHPSDILLSRLALDAKVLRPLKFAENEFGLSWSIRQSWKRLEDGLSHVSRILFDAVNVDMEHILLRPFDHWPYPSDCGYLDLHGTVYKATRAIQRAREAMMFLAARCSLAIAIWVKGPSSRHSWVFYLERRGIPQSWIEALQQSVVSQFAHGLRVGTVVDPVIWNNYGLLDLYKRSLLPIIIRWPSRDQTGALCTQYPTLEPFTPRGTDGQGAYFNPPHLRSPDVYLIFHNNVTRTLPILSNNSRVPPCGPFQQPGETSSAFILRMDALGKARMASENPHQRARRLRREAKASPDNLPPPWIKVYVWVKAAALDPDIQADWATLDVRVLAHTSAVPGLWECYGRTQKYYNYVYDAWDLGGEVPLQLQPPSSAEQPLDVYVPLVFESSDINRELQDDMQFLFTSLDVRDSEVKVVVLDTALEDYYGVHRSIRTIPGVEYGNYSNHVEQCFGMMKGQLDGDADGRRTYSGFIWSVLNDKLLTDATQYCWDLDPRCEHYVLNLEGLQERILRITPAPITSAAKYQLFIIQFSNDVLLSWMLAANAAVIMFLLRKNSITTAAEAIRELLNVGLPFHTLRLSSSHDTRSSFDLALPAYTLPTYRRRALRLTSTDYCMYELKVMELLHRPHIRAALMAGGIIWRIAMHIVGYDDVLAQDIQASVAEGPSIHHAAHAALVKATGGLFYVDDILNDDEEDIFAGVHHLFTEQRGQTEKASWWPRQSQWVGSGMDNGVWTAWNEHFFQQRLNEIRKGEAQLKNIREWKNAVALYRPTVVVERKLRQAAETFLQPA